MIKEGRLDHFTRYILVRERVSYSKGLLGDGGDIWFIVS